MPRNGFRSAFDHLGSEVTLAQILAFHRARFGDARMSNDDPPAPPPAPTPPAPPSGDAGDDKGFPADTPIAEMTVEQQAAYWKHQSRKHETAAKQRADYDTILAENARLKQATQTDAEKALEAAKSEAVNAGKAQARDLYVPQLVAAKLEAALAGKLPADKIAGQVQFLDHTKFLTESGEVDTDKVKLYADGISPQGGQWPDMGNGNRGKETQTKGVAAGQDLFAASRGKKTSP